MNSNIFFDRQLYQNLPMPVALAYRKAFNSGAAKELHDNSCHFAFCLLRLLAIVSIANLRDCRVALGDTDAELLERTDRPSEGHRLQWLLRSLIHVRKQRLPSGSPAALLDQYLYEKRKGDESAVPDAVGTLLSFVQHKDVVRRKATAVEYWEALIAYRNRTLGHGAVLTEELNQSHGEQIYRAATELASTLTLWDEWDLKFVAASALEPTAVVCSFGNLMGPEWLREPPVQYPQGYPAPLANHVVLVPREGNRGHLDLHPLLCFHNERVCFFNGTHRRQVTFLDFQSGESVRPADLMEDYEHWKSSLSGETISGDSDSENAAESDDSMQLELSLEQRFRYDKMLGKGGMGEVWLAFDNVLQRPVAIKRIRPELVDRPDVHRRFLQEARDAARLSHAHVVPILTIEQDPDGPFLVLEYMQGGNLRHQLKEGRLALPVALAYLRQILQALKYSHEQNLIHRDIKPENVLLTKAGVPKLADFGLAWVLGEEAGDRPVEARAVNEGTRAYLAPELRDMGESPSARTDIYSLGLTFYEMLTGLSPKSLNSKEVPSQALPLLRKMVHRNPNLRYHSAGSVLEDCLELERSLDLAGRSRDETLVRTQRALQQAFLLVGENQLVNAAAGFERVLNEIPDSVGGLAGMTLAHLTDGNLPEAARYYKKLLAIGQSHPVFDGLQNFFGQIHSPTQLALTAYAMPFSYQIDDLASGKFVKDLAEYARGTLNLGDVGELLLELFQQRRSESRLVYQPAPPGGRHRLSLEISNLLVNADYAFDLRSGFLLAPPKIEGIDVQLTIQGSPFDIYRFVRYMTNNLQRRFKRDAANWIEPSIAQRFGYDVHAARSAWQQLECPFERLARSASVPDA